MISMWVTAARFTDPSSLVGTVSWSGQKMRRQLPVTSTAKQPSYSPVSGWQRSGGLLGTSAKEAPFFRTPNRIINRLALSPYARRISDSLDISRHSFFDANEMCMNQFRYQLGNAPESLRNR